ncbi:MAG TPA: hypothetical protein VGP47_01320 [Parachlamydiaceae bacterium]|nr:hypothetical protein [Parachlamydiaceae bacterium]
MSINPNFIDYSVDFNALTRISERHEKWTKNKNIEELMNETELFGAECAELCFGSPVTVLWMHEFREDFERLRCVLAKSILARKDFKIYAFFINAAIRPIVYLKNQSHETHFDVDLSKSNGKIRNYSLLQNANIFEAICNLAGLDFKNTFEKHNVRRHESDMQIHGYIKAERVEVLSFEWKHDKNLIARPEPEFKKLNISDPNYQDLCRKDISFPRNMLPALSFELKHAKNLIAKPEPELKNLNISDRDYQDLCRKDISFPRNLYDDYLKGSHCDCEIISDEGRVIKLHSSVYNDYSLTKMPKENIVKFDNYREKTIRAFVDSLYLEKNEFVEKYLHSNIPIFQLLALAHERQNDYLKSICIEIICEVATFPDAQNIRNINKTYQNFFLHQLYEKLIQTENSSNTVNYLRYEDTPHDIVAQ